MAAKAPAKPKAKAKPAKAKAAPKVEEPSLTPDEQAHVGFFARVVDGPHKGRYGFLRSLANGIGILTTRDAHDENLPVKIEHLRPDQAGRR